MPVLAKFVSITRTKLAHRGITVSRESIRYGPSSLALYTLVDCSENTECTAIPYTLMNYSPVCRIIQVNGKQHYLWRAVDQDGEVVDAFLQAKRDGAAAKRFFKRLLKSHGSEPREIVTDKHSQGATPLRWIMVSPFSTVLLLSWPCSTSPLCWTPIHPALSLPRA